MGNGTYLFLLSFAFSVTNCAFSLENGDNEGAQYRPEAVAILDYLNSAPIKVYNYKNAVVQSAHRKADIAELTLDVYVECLDGYPNLPCTDDVLTCSGFVQRLPQERGTVLGDIKCKPKTVGVAPVANESPVPPPQNSNQWVALSNEAVSQESGEHFVAVRRDSVPCLGCPFDLNTDALGVDELINLGLQHVESERAKKHAVVKVLRVQQQVVAGVKYILLLEVAPTVCDKNSPYNLEACPLDATADTFTCEIVYLQKPWINKAKHIISNNCTTSQEYVPPESSNSGRNYANNDIDNEIDVNGDRVKPLPGEKRPFYENPNFDRIAESGTIDEEMSPSRLADLESQILFIEPDLTPVRPPPAIKLVETEPELVPLNFDFVDLKTDQPEESDVVVSSSAILPEENQAIEDRPNNGDNTEDSVNAEDIQPSTSSSPDYDIETTTATLLWASEQVDEDFLTTVDPELDQLQSDQPQPAENSTSSESSSSEEKTTANVTTTSKDNSSSSEENSSESDEKKRPKRAVRQLEKISPDEKNLVKDLADYGALALDNMDDDNNRRVVLQILGAKKMVADGGVYYHLILRLGISQCQENKPPKPNENCKEKLLENYTKICKIQIHVNEEFGNPKVVKSQCQNIKRDNKSDSNRTNYSRHRRDVLVGGQHQYDKNDPQIAQFLRESVTHLDSTSSYNNRYKPVEVLNVTSQVVAGVNYRIRVKIALSDCSKNDDKDLDSCNLLSDAAPKICNIEVWQRVWLKRRQITINCENEPEHKFELTDSRKRREAARLLGGQQQESLDNPRIFELLQNGLVSLDSQLSHQNKLKVLEVISATRQIVSGELWRIKARVALSDCDKNDFKEPSQCNILDGAEPQLCHFTVWDQPWLPQGRQTNVTCDYDDAQYSFRTKRQAKGAPSEAGDDPRTLEYLTTVLQQLDSQSSHDNKYKVHKVLSATKQVVSGSLWRIKAEIVLSDCSKNDNKELSKCQKLEGAEPKTCNFKIWDQPWLPNGRKTNVTCEDEERQYSFRSKRQVPGGESSVSVDNPEIFPYLATGLQHLDSQSSHDNKYKVHEVLSATRQVVSGSLWRIKAKIVLSDCSKNDNKELSKCQKLDGAEPRTCNFKVWDQPWLPNGRETEITCEDEERQYSFRSKRQIPGGESSVSTDNPEILQYLATGLEHLDSQSSHDNKYKVHEILSATRQVVSGSLWRIKAKIVLSDCSKNDNKELSKCLKLEGAEPRTCNFKIWDQPWLPNGRETNVTCEDEERQYSFRSKRQIKGGESSVSVDNPEIFPYLETGLQHLDSQSSHDNKYKVHEVLSATRQVVSGSLWRIKAKIVLSDCSKNDNKELSKCQKLDGAEPRTCNFKVWDQPWLPNGRETEITCEDEERQYSFRSKRQVLGGESSVSTDNPEILQYLATGLEHLDSQSSHENKYKVHEILSATHQVVSGSAWRIKAKIVLSDCSKNDNKELSKCQKLEGAEPRTCNFKIWDQPWLPNGRETNVTCEDEERQYSFRSKRQITGGESSVSVDNPEIFPYLETGLQHLDSQSSHDNKYKVHEVLSATRQVVSGSLWRIKAKIVLSDCSKNDNKELSKCQKLEGAEPRTCNFKIWDQPWLPNGRETNVTCEDEERQYSFRSKRQVLGGESSVSTDNPEILQYLATGLEHLDSQSSHENKYKVHEILSATHQVVSGSAWRIKAKIVLSDCSKNDNKELSKCQKLEGAEPRTCNFKIWDQPWLPNGRETNVTCEDEERQYSFRSKRQITGGESSVSVDNPEIFPYLETGLQHLDSQSSHDNKYKVHEVLSATRQVVSGSLWRIKAKIVLSDCSKNDNKELSKCQKLEGAEPRTCNFKIWDQPWLPNGRETNVTCEDEERQYSFRSKRQVLGGESSVSTDNPEILQYLATGLEHLDSQSSHDNKYKVHEILSATHQVVSGSAWRIKAKIVLSDCSKNDNKELSKCQKLEGAEPRTCNFKIWDQPWLPNGRETNVTCEDEERQYSFRSKRQVLGGESSVSTDNPEILQYLATGLEHLDSQSSHDNKYKVHEILSATHQVVSGSAWRIKAKIVLSDCSKNDNKELSKCQKLEGAEPRTCNFKIWVQPWLPNGRETNVTCEDEERQYSFRSKRQIRGGESSVSVDNPEIFPYLETGLQHLDSQSSHDNKYKVHEVLSATRQVVSGSLWRIKAKIVLSDCSKNDNKELSKCQKLDGAEPRTCNFEVWDQPWLPNGRETEITCEDEERKYSFRSKRQITGGESSVSVDNPEIFPYLETGLQHLDSQSSHDNKYKVHEILSATRQVVSGSLWRIKAKIVLSDCSKNDNKELSKCQKLEGAEPRTCNFKVWDQPWLPNGRETEVTCEDEERQYSFRSKRQVLGGESSVSTDNPEILQYLATGLEHLDSQSSHDNKYKVHEILSATHQVVSGSAWRIKAKIVLSDCSKNDNKELSKCQKLEGAEPRTCNFKIWDQPWLPNGRETNVTCEDEERQYSFRSKRQITGGESSVSVDNPEIFPYLETGLQHLDSQSSHDNKYKVHEVLSATRQVVSGSLWRIKAKIVLSDCSKNDNKELSKCQKLEGAEPRTCNFKIWDQPWLPNGRETNVTCEDEERQYSFRSKRQVLGGESSVSTDNPEILQYLATGLEHLDSQSSHDNKYKVHEILSATHQVVSGSAWRIKAKIVLSDCSKNDNKELSKCQKLEGAEPRTCNFQIWDQSWLPNGRETNVTCEDEERQYSFRSKRQIKGGESSVSVDNPEIFPYLETGLQHLDSQSSHDNKYKVHEVLSATRQVVSGSLWRIKAKIVLSDCSKNDNKELSKCQKLDGAEPRTCNFKVWDQPWLPNGRETEITCEDEERQYSFRSKRQVLGGESSVSNDNPEILQYLATGLQHLDSQSTHDNKYKVHEILSATHQVVSGSAWRIKAKIVLSDCSKNDNKELSKCQKLEGAEPRTCNFQIWDQSWLPNGRETNVTCEDEERQYSFRSKRQITGGESSVSVDNPEIFPYLETGLQHLDSQSSHDNKYKVHEVLSATRQVVSGSLWRIKAKIVLSDCSKNDNKELSKCQKLEGAEPRTCNFKVWDQPWLPNGRETEITCEDEERQYSFRSKRQVAGGQSSVSVDSPEILPYLTSSLRHLDSQSSHDNKYKVHEVLSATRQVVAGSVWRIQAKIVLSDCSKNDNKELSECQRLDGAEPKTCNFKIWDQAWLPNGRETTITCDDEDRRYFFRTKREVRYHHSPHLLGKDDHDIHHSMFREFVTKYKKTYPTTKEAKHRFHIFRQNLKFIRLLNKHEQGTAKYGITQFADVSRKEFSGSLGLRQDLRMENEMPFFEASTPDVELPVEYDWRDKGAVTAVKNQGQCGSCWAFSVTGNVEGQYAIKKGNLLEFSEQELVDCDSVDQGCDGGLMDNAYRVIEKLGGLETEGDYPYEAEDEKCHFNRTLARVQLSGALNISHNETDMAKWLVKNGPISIAINANAMQFYVGGVSHPLKFLCNPDSLDHGVLIVGYGAHKYPLFNKTLPYWIVKNSWGSSWGEQGYYRVYRGDGTCGLNQTPSSAIVA